MAALPGAESDSFFAAYNLGTAYHLPGARASKKAKINSAIREAQARGVADEVLSAAAGFCKFEQANDRISAQTQISPREVVNLPNQSRIFISHASEDQKIAKAIKYTLVTGGVPNDRIFFSSGESTGIPTGENVLQNLQTTLAESALVLEVVTRGFLTRPYCLMELGGAWALKKPTFPIVIPPLTISEATKAVGNVKMRIFGSKSDIDAAFGELHDTIESALGMSLGFRQWNEAVHELKETDLGLGF